MRSSSMDFNLMQCKYVMICFFTHRNQYALHCFYFHRKHDRNNRGYAFGYWIGTGIQVLSALLYFTGFEDQQAISQYPNQNCNQYRDVY